MTDSIKIGSLDISSFKVGSGDCTIYLGDTLLYPTEPPLFQGKWLATYTGGATFSAECDSSSAITNGEITKRDLVSVEIGNCVTSIGNQAFYSAASLVSIVISDSVTSFSGSENFRFCTSLTSVTIPSGVTSIGGYAFDGCSGLTSITINATTPPTLPISSKYVFRNTNNCPIYVPSESVDTYKAAKRWSSYASRIQAIPNS